MSKTSLCIAAFWWTTLALKLATGQEQPQAVFDHHVHVLSPRLISDWKSLGMKFSRPAEDYWDSSRIMRQTGVAGAFLVSMAHLYTTDDFRQISTSIELERRLVAAENDYVAVSVAGHPAEFVGFFSVNLFRDYAFDELRRCMSNPNLTGLKLHLPSCGFDLTNQQHWDSLSKILSWAAQNKVPVLLHLSAGEEIDLEKSTSFWKKIIQPNSSLELYLAHLGSVGGFNRSSENILIGYHQCALENVEFRKMAIYFDLSAAIMGENSESRRTSDDRCQRLSIQMSKIGIDRFLFASDYPVFSVSETRANLTNRLSLTEDDVSKLLSNRSHLFDRSRDLLHKNKKE
jgi:predicted TIM-barrel fold metal-dependent hydrolase